MSKLREFFVNVVGVDRPRLKVNAGDVVGDEKKGAQCRVAVTNNTDVPLQLRATLGPKGQISVGPGQIIKPNRTIEFDATDDEQIDFGITWQTPKKEGAEEAIWFTRFKFKPVKANEGAGEFESFMSRDPDERFDAPTPTFKGKRFEFGLNLRGAPPPPPPPITGKIQSTVHVENGTGKTLRRVKNELSADEATPSVGKLAPGGSITVVAGGTREAITGLMTWRLEEEKDEVWSLTWHMDLPAAGQQENTPTSASSAALDKRFTAVKPDFGKGPKATFKFRLEGGSTPPPPPQQEGNVSCLITVTNNTQSVLTLLKPNNERGDFFSFPQPTLKPGDSTNFVYVQTTKETEADKLGCKGSLTWEIGSPKVAEWVCGWENFVAEKNQAPTKVDPPQGFQPLGLPGQGDENVPFSFILKGGGGTPPPPPPPPPPQEKEPDFIPPERETEPTLRLGDKSKDGWVEYLQDLLGVKNDTRGVFGPATRAAVEKFQRKNAIQADGVVGFQTWAQLRHTDAKPASTDRRAPHTFEDKGPKARWVVQEAPANFEKGSGRLSLAVVSVGTEPIGGREVTMRITRPGKANTVIRKISDTETKQSDEGVIHFVIIDNFKDAFPSEPPGADIKDYFIEAFIEKALGADFWKGKIREV